MLVQSYSIWCQRISLYGYSRASGRYNSGHIVRNLLCISPELTFPECTIPNYNFESVPVSDIPFRIHGSFPPIRDRISRVENWWMGIPILYTHHFWAISIIPCLLSAFFLYRTQIFWFSCLFFSISKRTYFVIYRCISVFSNCFLAGCLICIV